MVSFFLGAGLPEISERTKFITSVMAGMRSKNTMIMIKLRIITSVDGVEPRNSAAKIAEKMTIYTMAMEAIITIYENILSQMDDRLSER